MEQAGDALALRKSLAEQSPWYLNKQLDYARHLLQAGQLKPAYDWVQKTLDRPIAWTDGEDEMLRSAPAEFFRTEVRWDELLHYTTQWINRNPSYSRAYQEHLSALVYNNQLDAANALAEKWLQQAQTEEKFTPDQQVRLDTALSFAQGSCCNLQIDQNSMLPRWEKPLFEAAQYFGQHKGHFDIVQRIVSDWRFSQLDAGDRFRGLALGLLQTNLSTLTPEQIGSFVEWANSGRIELPEALAGRTQLDASEIPNSVWKKIADELHQRWLKTEDTDQKNSLGESLRSIYANRFSDTDLLPFLRERIASAPKQYKPGYIAALFDALIGQKWTQGHEDEAFTLLHKLSDAEETSDRLATQVLALFRLVDGVIASRQGHDEQELQDQGKTDQLTRIELRNKKAEFAKAAKTALEIKLAGEADAVENAITPDPMALALLPWLRIEQAYLDLQLDQSVPPTEEFCWTILGETPPKPKVQAADEQAQAEADMTVGQLRQEVLDATLRQRACHYGHEFGRAAQCPAGDHRPRHEVH